MWKTVRLGDVCDFQNGFAFKSALFKESGKPILRISNIQNEKIDVRKTVFFDAKDYDTDFTRYEVKPDDLVIAMSGATTGKIGFNKTDTTYYLNQRVGNLKPKPVLDKVFLYYLLSTKVQENLSISRGAAQPNLSSEQIKNISFSLPPLAEQESIVAKLDAAFAEIDKAVAVTTKNIETIEVLFQNCLNKNFQNSEFKYIELDKVCNIIGGGTPSKKNKSFYNGEVPWATVRDMKNDYIINTQFKITNDAIKKSSTNIVPSGNIVIATRVGLGKTCIISDDTAINQDLKGIIPKNKELVDTDFLFFWFKAISKIIINAGTGATVQGVKLPFIKSLKIPDIDISLQRQIASNTRFISEQNELLASIYNKKLNHLTRLKSSFLKQALIGKLRSEAV